MSCSLLAQGPVQPPVASWRCRSERRRARLAVRSRSLDHSLPLAARRLVATAPSRCCAHAHSQEAARGSEPALLHARRFSALCAVSDSAASVEDDELVSASFRERAASAASTGSSDETLASRIAAGEFSSQSPFVDLLKPLRKWLAQLPGPGASPLWNAIALPRPSCASKRRIKRPLFAALPPHAPLSSPPQRVRLHWALPSCPAPRCGRCPKRRATSARL